MGIYSLSAFVATMLLRQKVEASRFILFWFVRINFNKVEIEQGKQF